MHISRRALLEYAAMAGAAALGQVHSKAATSKPGMPGPFPGLVVGVEHPGSILNGAYQAEPVRQMMEKGMTALSGAPGWTDAWRYFFEKGDVVGIKVCPVGGAKLCSDATVLHAILDGLNQAGVPGRDVIVYNRYREETLAAGIDKWLPEGVRMEFGSAGLQRNAVGHGRLRPRPLHGDGADQARRKLERPALPPLLRGPDRDAADQQVHQPAGAQASPVGRRDHRAEEHVARHGEQREPQPPDGDGQRLRYLHPFGREPAGDSGKSRAAHLRRGEGVLPRRSRRHARSSSGNTRRCTSRPTRWRWTRRAGR